MGNICLIILTNLHYCASTGCLDNVDGDVHVAKGLKLVLFSRTCLFHVNSKRDHLSTRNNHQMPNWNNLKLSQLEIHLFYL